MHLLLLMLPIFFVKLVTEKEKKKNLYQRGFDAFFFQGEISTTTDFFVTGDINGDITTITTDFPWITSTGVLIVTSDKRSTKKEETTASRRSTDGNVLMTNAVSGLTSAVPGLTRSSSDLTTREQTYEPSSSKVTLFPSNASWPTFKK